MDILTEPIDFESLAAEHGVRKGKIAYSDTFNSWVIIGHPYIDMIMIEPPHPIGTEINGKIVREVKIENNHWKYFLTSSNTPNYATQGMLDLLSNLN